MDTGYLTVFIWGILLKSFDKMSKKMIIKGGVEIVTKRLRPTHASRRINRRQFVKKKRKSPAIAEISG